MIGPKVEKIFAALSELLPAAQEAAGPQTQDVSLFNRLLATLSAIFTPYIGVLAGVGVVKRAGRPAANAGAYLNQILAVCWCLTPFPAACLSLLPLFIAVTAADRFKTSRFTALALTAAMVFPLTDAATPDHVELFHLAFPLKIYGGAVIPAIFAVWFLSYVERWCKKWVPEIAAPGICTVPVADY
ncbi:EIIBCA-Bgl [Kluyvera cryocrescens]|uniref:EIIBCA-Bgl n=1 Tax=Kluyvera cryocrescens TaxID=580 RepID=A0A485BIB6_KLUCR|nr:EIIBCA-Bgl [Kluyvera cryocrescens]